MTRETSSKLAAESGTSLVELMVATASGVLILGAVLTMTIRQSAQRQANAEMNLALTAAADTLEQVRSVPFAQLPSLNGTGFDIPDSNGVPGGLRPMADDKDGLPGSLQVQAAFDYNGARLYRVAAEVEWTGAQRRTRIELLEFVAERK